MRETCVPSFTIARVLIKKGVDAHQHQGVDAASNDLSWTSGFVRIARWLALYYGDQGTVVSTAPMMSCRVVPSMSSEASVCCAQEKHWEQLKRWTDG